MLCDVYSTKNSRDESRQFFLLKHLKKIPNITETCGLYNYGNELMTGESTAQLGLVMQFLVLLPTVWVDRRHKGHRMH